jgi:type IV fimbrial biogenesis protein FimT
VLADQVRQLRQLNKAAAMKQHGFTLIEVIITVVIAAFLVAAALPSVGTWMRNTRIRSTAESISTGLQQARNEAVRRNQPVGLYLVSDADAMSMSDACALSSSSSAWVIALSSPAGKCATDRSSFIALRPAGDSAGGLTVAAVDGTSTASSSIAFNGYGQISGASSISCIRISSTADTSARALNVAVGVGGQIRMCDPAVTDSNDPRLCTPACN